MTHPPAGSSLSGHLSLRQTVEVSRKQGGPKRIDGANGPIPHCHHAATQSPKELKLQGLEKPVASKVRTADLELRLVGGCPVSWSRGSTQRDFHAERGPGAAPHSSLPERRYYFQEEIKRKTFVCGSSDMGCVVFTQLCMDEIILLMLTSQCRDSEKPENKQLALWCCGLSLHL